MPNKINIGIIALSLVILIGFSSAASLTLPTGITTYVPINITNSQATAASAGFQQMLIINNSKYSQYLANSNQNREFFYANGSLITSWIENNLTNTTHNQIVWVKINPAIAASSTYTIYMGFAAMSTNLLSNTTTGVAPQLTSTYAQYDNGANVFSNYQNFAGTTLWSGLSPISTLTLSQDNGLQITTTTSQSYAVMTNWDIASPNIFEGLVTAQNAGGSTNYKEGLMFDTGTSTSYIGVPSTTHVNYLGRCLSGSGIGTSTHCIISYEGTPLVTNILSVEFTFPYTSVESFQQSSTGVSFFDNGYTQTASTTTLSSGYVGIYLFSDVAANHEFIQWLRTRDYPPAGIMPSVSFGTIITITSLIITPTGPFIYPQPIIKLIAKCSISADICAIEMPIGTILNQTTNKGYANYSITMGALAAGTYNVKAIDLNTTVNQTGSFIINQNSTQLSLSTDQPSLIPCKIVFMPYSCTTQANVFSYKNQLYANLNLTEQINGVKITKLLSTFNINYVYAINNKINYYTFTLATAGNQNYTANSINESWYGIMALYARNATNIITLNVSPITKTGWHYPYQLYSQSNNATVKFYLNQSINSTVPTGLQTNVSNVSYVPPTTQLSNNYKYIIIEKQYGNMSILNFTLTPANMLVIKSQPLPYPNTNELLKYFPIAINNVTFYNLPTEWAINTYTNKSTAPQIIDTKGSSTLKLNLSIQLTYKQFSPQVQFNLTKNLGLTTMNFTLTNFTFTNSTPASRTPAFPNNNRILNLSSFDQEFFTPINSMTTISLSAIFNNYTFTFSKKIPLNQSAGIFISNSTFQNPQICLNNVSIISTAPNHYTTINNMLSFCQASGSWRILNIYLPNANSTLTQFIIYQGGGYGGYGDTMQVFTGPTPSNLVQVQSFLIRTGGVPFTLPLQVSQEYEFKFYNSNGQLIYTSALTTWGSTVTIYLPNNIPIPVPPTFNATATCISNFNATANYSELNTNGTDPYNFVTQWQVKINQITSVLNTSVPLAEKYFNNTSSFQYVYPMKNKSITYQCLVIATAVRNNSGYSTILVNKIFNQQTYRLFGIGGLFIGMLFFFLAIAFGLRTNGLLLAILFLFLFVGTALTIYNFPEVVFIGLLLTAILLIGIFEFRRRY